MDLDKNQLLMKYETTLSRVINDIVIDRARDQLIYGSNTGIDFIKISLSTSNELSFSELGKEHYLADNAVKSIAIISHT